MKKSLIRMLLIWTILFVSILYFELVFKASLLIINFNDEFVFTLFFSLSYSLYLLFFLMFFKEKTVKRLLFLFIIGFTFLFLMQDLYHTVVENFYSIQIAGDFSLGLSFIGDVFLALRFRHIFYLVPLVILILINRKYTSFYDADYVFVKQPLLLLFLASLTLVLTQNFINDNRVEDGLTIMYTDKDLYEYVYDTQLTVKTFGLTTYILRDISNVFKIPPLREAEYVILLDAFLEARASHVDNVYTGALDDKNMILIMAESFDTFAIHPVLTPTLYALQQDHVSFTNYYSPLYYRSTADTEWMVQTSMFPNKNVTLTMEAYIDNHLPNTLPELFETQGYETFSYHNYIDYFYPRSDAHTALFGYNTYRGAEALGLMNEVDNGDLLFDHVWQRDLDLIELSIDDYIHEDKFFVNYITVSGHFNYNDEHEVAGYHTDALDAYLDAEDITLDDAIYYYLATAMELDLAVQTLMDTLDEANKLDDTVIMIFGDHYAYGISEETIWDYDTVKVENDMQDIHKVPMLMYAPNTMLSGAYDTYMSSIDIMPTIANLFDLPMTYEYAFGVDVFSDAMHLVRFPDMSFKTSMFNYDALTESYRFYDDTYTLNDLRLISQMMINEYRYNMLLLDYDYFNQK